MIRLKLVTALLAMSCLGLSIRPMTAAETVRSNATVAAKLPATVDLRPKFDEWGLKRRDQGARGTCSVFTIASALEFANAAKQNRGERFSVEYLNWAANQATRRPKDGGFFSDMWSGFSRYGICTEDQMPYRKEFDPSTPPKPEAVADGKARLDLGLQHQWIKRWDVSTGLKDEEFTAIKRTLKDGWPVCGGFRWPNREHWKQDVLQMCPPEAVFDGHSILLVGYRDDAAEAGGGVFIFRNTNRGGRDGYMPYEYAKAYMNDAIWISPADKAKADASANPRESIQPGGQ